MKETKISGWKFIDELIDKKEKEKFFFESVSNKISN
jgi:hypothetical protein